MKVSGRPALEGVRICDLSGQLAGAGSTRLLAAFGAEVIRIEDPVREGRWDVVRGAPPYVDERRGRELGGGFNNHNVGKLGITIDLRSDRGRELFGRLVAVSDVVTENFSAAVMDRLGLGYEQLRRWREDVIYVANSGFGQAGPHAHYKSFGPVVQAACGLTFNAGLPGEPPSGWGFSYMDHLGASYMAMAVLAALIHRRRTGEGQWVDMSCVEAGATLNGPALLDYEVNGRPLRRPGMPDGNHSQWPAMCPHNVFPARGDDEWIALACRHDGDWVDLAKLIAEPWAAEERFSGIAGRRAAEHELDSLIAGWTETYDRFDLAGRIQSVGVPATAVARPEDRIDGRLACADWELWPAVDHPDIGKVRVEGLPVHLSDTDWSIASPAPRLGQHTDSVLAGILGLSEAEITDLHAAGVV